MKRLILAVLLCGCGIDFYHPPQDASPTPEPTQEPSQTPEVTPTAFPEPSPAATVQMCDLPPSSALQESCEDRPSEEPKFWEDVTEAQRLAAANGYTVGSDVVNEVLYTTEVARILRSMGLCASSQVLPDEVWVKDSNDFSEHFDIVTSEGKVWQQYAAKCSPAKF